MSTGFKKRIDSRRYVGINNSERVDLGWDDDGYPMSCVFSGPDHDTDALAFIETLKERATPSRPGILEHPREGIKEVVVESVATTHDPVHDAAETIVEVVFLLQIRLPGQRNESPVVATRKQFEAVNAAGANDFSLAQSVATAGDRLATIQEVKAQLKNITNAIGDVVAANAQALATFNAIQADILQSLDTIVKSPLTLATQMQQMTQAALAVPGNLAEKTVGWIELYNAAIGNSNLFDATPTSANKNRVATQELTATSGLSANLANVVFQIDQFDSKSVAFDALSRAQQEVLNLGADLDYMQDTYEKELLQDRFYSQREAYQELSELTRVVTAATRQLSGRLRTTVTVKLLSDTHLYDLAAKYYRDVSDDSLDFIIDQNGLTLENLYVIPAGTELEI
jgi:hypothetical protein